MSETMPCEECGARVPVPDDWPVDWTICRSCRAAAAEAYRAFRAEHERMTR